MKFIPRELLIGRPVIGRCLRLHAVSIKGRRQCWKLNRGRGGRGDMYRRRGRTRDRNCHRSTRGDTSRNPRTRRRVHFLSPRLHPISTGSRRVILPRSNLQWSRLTRDRAPFHFPRILLFQLLTHVITRRPEGLGLTLNRHASIINFRNLCRPSPIWRAFQIRGLIKDNRIANPHIRTLDGHIICQQSL